MDGIHPEQNQEMNTPQSEYELYVSDEEYIAQMKERRQRTLDNFINDDTIDSKQKIIAMLEMEFKYLEMQQSALFYSNDEMLKYDPSDEIIIESRAENLIFIEKNFARMKEIQEEVLQLAGDDHYICKKDLFEVFRENEIIDDGIQEQTGRTEEVSQSQSNSNSNSEVINEIDL